MLTIWGRISSINVQKVVWCADELGLTYKRIDAGGAFGGNHTPEYLSMNPNALVPTIDDEGFILYESNAIVRYLCAKHPKSGLWPENLRERADVDRWMEWLSTTLVPATRDAFLQLIRVAPERRDASIIEKSTEASENGFAILDAHLAKNRYVSPTGFTAADIVTGCAAHRWLNLPLKQAPKPNVDRWYADLKSRPGSRQVTSLVLS
jgi:glutathione S-transferase